MNLLFVFLLFSSHIFCQFIDSTNNIVGSRLIAYLENTTASHPLGESNTFLYGIEPYYVRNFNRLGIGITGEYRNVYTTLEVLDFPNHLYGVGLMVRFTYPLPKFIKNEKYRNQISILSEASYSFTNYYFDKDIVFKRPSNYLENQVVRITPMVFYFNIFNNFNVDLAFGMYKFFPGRFGRLSTVGVSYSF